MKLLIVCFGLFLFCLRIYSSPISNKEYYPRYHLAPPYAWMNDPNGFCFFKNSYHLFYQFNPYSAYTNGKPHWGHAKSKDLFYWKDLGIAMYPNQSYDKSGVFSGSCLVENKTMYLFYTGNVNITGQNTIIKQRQALAISTDGINVMKFEGNPIISGNKYQPNFRDPKVWKHNGTYYMVVGNSYNNSTLGRALLFSSKNMKNWKLASVLLKSSGRLGYMWECPDFFEIGGLFILLISPQGMKPEGDNFRNLYQTGYIVGLFDYSSLIFTPITKFREIDHGHDFYATQTTNDPKGNRIMVAWLNMWNTSYPDQEDGFSGLITIPRTLFLSSDYKIIQKPVYQVANARGKLIYSDKSHSNRSIKLNDKTAEIKIVAQSNKNLDLYIESGNSSRTVKISFDSIGGYVILNRNGNDGIRRTKWRPEGKLQWDIFIDASSIELFCGEGEVTFSSRFFPTGNVSIRLSKNSTTDEIKVFNMKHTLYVN